MKKIIIVMAVAISLTVSGCGKHRIQRPSQAAQSSESEDTAESIANTEYDSIEDFLEDNNAPVFIMESEQFYNELATNSNAATLDFVGDHVSVGGSYISVIYECKAGDDTFKIDLATYNTNRADEQLAYVVDSNPGIFTEVNISGISVYYCPGSEYEWFDCYAMVIDEKLVVVNIEKGYGKYMEDVLNNIVLR